MGERTARFKRGEVWQFTRGTEYDKPCEGRRFKVESQRGASVMLREIEHADGSPPVERAQVCWLASDTTDMVLVYTPGKAAPSQPPAPAPGAAAPAKGRTEVLERECVKRAAERLADNSGSRFDDGGEQCRHTHAYTLQNDAHGTCAYCGALVVHDGNGGWQTGKAVADKPAPCCSAPIGAEHEDTCPELASRLVGTTFRNHRIYTATHKVVKAQDGWTEDADGMACMVRVLLDSYTDDCRARPCAHCPGTVDVMRGARGVCCACGREPGSDVRHATREDFGDVVLHCGECGKPGDEHTATCIRGFTGLVRRVPGPLVTDPAPRHPSHRAGMAERDTRLDCKHDVKRGDPTVTEAPEMYCWPCGSRRWLAALAAWEDAWGKWERRRAGEGGE